MTSNASDRLSAALTGRYRVERELGEGGMAKVYLARDLRHNRHVALKVLKSELAAVVGAQRFLAEIQTTANLQHPHILPLYDSGEADGFLFYVMPYVAGETLSDRLDREKQLPVEEAVRTTVAVANALDYAHQHGVIHRDIKPGNILIQAGEPVVGDFGIALAVGAASGDRLTETGLSLGTPFYMSPEQATGDQIVGPASDIYSLGAVLYELLTGDPPFTGRTAQAVLGKILQGEPVSATSRRKSIPPNVDAAIRKALEKLPADRFTSALHFAKALQDPSFRHGEPSQGLASSGGGRWRLGAAAGVVIGVGLGIAIGAGLFAPEPPPVVRFPLAVTETQHPIPGGGVYVALSPDGRRIVYRGYTSTGESQLYERPLDATGSSPWTGPAVEARPIPGSEDARNLALSPDGLSVAFTSGFSLMTLSLLGGPPVSLGAQINPLGSRAGIDWAEDGFIYFNGPQGTISRIPAGGGSPEVIARPDSGSSGYGLVDVLPGGRGFVVALTSGGPSQNRQIAVMSESGGNVKILFPGVMARYATSGHLVYVTADNTLMAVPFDIRRLEVTGEAVALIEGVVVNAGTQPTQFALSESGTLVYLDGGIGRLSQVVLVTRGGTATPVDPGWAPAPIFSLALSPDETRLAVSISSSSLSADVPQDIWVKQLDRGPLPKLTFDARFNVRPSWTPDSRSLSFVSARSGVRGPPGRDIWIARADGSGEPKVLASLERSIYGATWSNDGQWLVAQVGGFGASDIVAWRVGADSVPGVGRTFSEADMVSIVASPADEYAPALSPDGRLLAYVSDEAGQVEVFVSPFPNARDWKMQVSIGGGGPPVWARSGLELFYHAGPEDVTAINSSMVAVPVANAQAFQRGEPEVLFATDGYVGPGVFPHYAVTRDGQFIMARYVDVATPVRINVVLNFLQELKVRVGG